MPILSPDYYGRKFLGELKVDKIDCNSARVSKIEGVAIRNEGNCRNRMCFFMCGKKILFRKVPERSLCFDKLGMSGPVRRTRVNG